MDYRRANTLAAGLVDHRTERRPVRVLATEPASWVGTTGLWLYWAFDELIRGVNPWRRALGLGVIVWQSLRLIG